MESSKAINLNTTSNKETSSKNSSEIISSNNKSNILTITKTKRNRRAKLINEINKNCKNSLFSSKIINLNSSVIKVKYEEEKYKQTIKFLNIKNKLELKDKEVSEKNMIKSMTFDNN